VVVAGEAWENAGMGFWWSMLCVKHTGGSAARRRRSMCCVSLVGACVWLATGCASSHSGHALPVLAPTTSSTSVRVATTTTTVPFVNYRVRKGDTLTKIASTYRVSASSIIALNHIAHPDLLPEGQTLTIPRAPPLRLVITPTTGSQGQAFQLTLTGAQPSGQFTFVVRSPTATFTGPPHIATAQGTVTATYQTGPSDPTGTFTVVAKANAAALGEATFTVTASTPVT